MEILPRESLTANLKKRTRRTLSIKIYINSDDEDGGVEKNLTIQLKDPRCSCSKSQREVSQDPHARSSRKYYNLMPKKKRQSSKTLCNDRLSQCNLTDRKIETNRRSIHSNRHNRARTLHEINESEQKPDKISRKYNQSSDEKGKRHANGLKGSTNAVTQNKTHTQISTERDIRRTGRKMIRSSSRQGQTQRSTVIRQSQCPTKLALVASKQTIEHPQQPLGYKVPKRSTKSIVFNHNRNKTSVCEKVYSLIGQKEQSVAFGSKQFKSYMEYIRNKKRDKNMEKVRVLKKVPFSKATEQSNNINYELNQNDQAAAADFDICSKQSMLLKQENQKGRCEHGNEKVLFSHEGDKAQKMQIGMSQKENINIEELKALTKSMPLEQEKRSAFALFEQADYSSISKINQSSFLNEQDLQQIQLEKQTSIQPVDDDRTNSFQFLPVEAANLSTIKKHHPYLQTSPKLSKKSKKIETRQSFKKALPPGFFH